jgi:hypothetical protein
VKNWRGAQSDAEEVTIRKRSRCDYDRDVKREKIIGTDDHKEAASIDPETAFLF